MLVMDCDFYKIGITKKDFFKQINQLIKLKQLLRPSIILSSGKGYQLIWLLKPFKNIEGYKNDKIWRKIQEYHFELLSDLKSDPVCKTPTAVTRICGTYNQKYKEKVQAYLVEPERYDLEQIFRFYKNFIEVNKPKSNYIKPYSNFRINNKIHYLKNEYSLNSARIDDIFTYVSIKNKRNESYIGIRNKLCLILRFHVLVVTNGDKEQAIKKVKDLIQILDMTDTTEEELLRRSELAEKYYEDWINDTWNKEKYIHGGLFYSNERLCKLLRIENDYDMQFQLKTIKVKNKEYEKYRKSMERRKAGVQSREEYENKRKQQKYELILRVKELKKEGLSNKKIGEILGLSSAYIGKLLRSSGG